MWLRRLDRRRRLYLAPFQWEWVLAEVGLTVAECEAAAWAVTPTGAMYRGAAAINVAFDQIIGWPAFCYKFYRLPLLKQGQDAVYQWVVGHRQYLPGVTPAIAQTEPWQPFL